MNNKTCFKSLKTRSPIISLWHPNSEFLSFSLANKGPRKKVWNDLNFLSILIQHHHTSYECIVVPNLSQYFCCAFEEMRDKFFTNTNLDVLLVIFVLGLIFDLSNRIAHFLRRSFNEVKEGLNVHITHNFDVEYFVD